MHRIPDRPGGILAVTANGDDAGGTVVRARIGVVDDHPSVVLGLASILNAQPDMHLTAGGASVAELLEQTAELDLVLLDLVLADGSNPASNLTALAPLGVPVLAYTSGDRAALVREAGRAGAAGMVRKSELPSVVVEAVRAVLRGEVVASADWAAALDSDCAFVSAELTDREAEVLALYASGETAERVGRQLFITRETVLDHVRRIRAKYAAVARPARTKVDLYRRAVEDGIMPARD